MRAGFLFLRRARAPPRVPSAGGVRGREVGVLAEHAGDLGGRKCKFVLLEDSKQTYIRASSSYLDLRNANVRNSKASARGACAPVPSPTQQPEMTRDQGARGNPGKGQTRRECSETTEAGPTEAV